MRHAIVVQRAGSEPERRELWGEATAGGSGADGVHLPGAPAGALLLQPCAAGVVVEARATGARAAGRPLPCGARRLLRPGEGAEVAGSCLRLLPAAAPEGTRLAAAALVQQAVAAGEPVSGPHLVVLTGAQAGTRYPLGAEQVLGRGRSATIRIADRLASRRHARLRLDAGGPRVEDLGSKNGLCVNGAAPARAPHALREGDELTVGSTTLALVGAPARAPARPAGSGSVAPPGRPSLRPSHAAAALLGLCALALALAS